MAKLASQPVPLKNGHDMATKPRMVRTSASLMYAFRMANQSKDARKQLDLRDSGGERLISGRRASVRALVSERELQNQIQFDLGQLMNTINLASTQDLDGYDQVQKSILNYGIPDLIHRTLDDSAVDEIVEELQVAIKRFEPRIAGKSIEVRRDMTVEPEELKIRFLISAEMQMQPENIPVEFVADIEIESSKIVINAR